MFFITPVYASELPPPTIVEPVEEVIEEKIVTWEDVFVRLPADLQATSLCESDIDGDGMPNPEAKNGHSTATGILQFLDGTYAWVWTEVFHTPVDWSQKNDPIIQMILGLWLYENYHLSHWECYTLGMV